jgi:hypothetical protein
VKRPTLTDTQLYTLLYVLKKCGLVQETETEFKMSEQTFERFFKPYLQP